MTAQNRHRQFDPIVYPGLAHKPARCALHSTFLNAQLRAISRFDFAFRMSSITWRSREVSSTLGVATRSAPDFEQPVDQP